MCQTNMDDTDPEIDLGQESLEFEVDEDPIPWYYHWIDIGGEG